MFVWGSMLPDHGEHVDLMRPAATPCDLTAPAFSASAGSAIARWPAAGQVDQAPQLQGSAD